VLHAHALVFLDFCRVLVFAVLEVCGAKLGSGRGALFARFGQAPAPRILGGRLGGDAAKCADETGATLDIGSGALVVGLVSHLLDLAGLRRLLGFPRGVADLPGHLALRVGHLAEEHRDGGARVQGGHAPPCGRRGHVVDRGIGAGAGAARVASAQGVFEFGPLW
jgi:hypothetical protein